MAENFDLIFGQNASQAQPWSDTDYQRGWETIGSTPPIAEQFDFVHNRQDKKAQELNNRLKPLEKINATSYRRPSTAYALKDIRYYSDLPTGYYLECTTAGTTDSGEITLPAQIVENATITDGTCVWKIRKIGSGDGEAVGVIKAFAGNGDIPSGYLLCDGAAVSRTMFPDLFAAIGTTYGSGDGSTTFNVPDYNTAQRFAQGSTVAGTEIAAGLPNITGTTDFGNSHTGINTDNYTSKGAFTAGGNTLAARYVERVQDANAPHKYLAFDASLSNPIYGNSDTVQPESLTVRYIIKAFDGQTADSALIDITQYAQRLEQKADRSLSNLTDAGKAFTFPSDTFISLTLTGSSMTYIAPANGYIKLRLIRSGTGGQIEASLYVVGSSLTTTNINPTSGSGGTSAFIPVKKGDEVRITANNYTTCTCLFIYAQGEVPTA